MRIPTWVSAFLLSLAIAIAGGLTLPTVMHEKAPSFFGKTWLNTPTPLSMEGLRGKVVIVHFWTFGCINCKHNLPAYEHWRKQFPDDQVAIIGIHTPEFEHEAVKSNVEKKIRELGVSFPVLLDPDQANWRRWKQQYWPAVYLVDRTGRIRYRWEGELNYGGLEGERRMAGLVQQLLDEKP